MALNSSLKVEVPLRNCSLTHLLLTAKLTLISKSECIADEENAATAEEAEKFLEMDAEEEKKMETDAAEDTDNLVCE